MTQQPRVLSLTQPWAWLVVNGYKDIENRRWHTKYRGWCYIHAAKGVTRGNYSDVVAFTKDKAPHITLPPFADCKRGGVIGMVRFTDCVQASESPWFFGPFGFVIAQAVAFDEMIPLTGHLGFFNAPIELPPPPATPA